MSSATAVARDGLARHDHLLALFASPSSRSRAGSRPVPADTPRAPFAGIDLAREAVIEGRVARGSDHVAGAHVRLLDARGAFVAEVPSDVDGGFRFFAAEGGWTVRVAVGSDVVAVPVEAVTGTVVRVLIEA